MNARRCYVAPPVRLIDSYLGGATVTPKQFETAKLVVITAVAVFITGGFISGYLHGRLPTPIFCLALLFILPGWLIMFTIWRRLRSRDAADRPPK